MQKPMIGAMYAPASSGPPRPSRPPALASSSITDNSPNLSTPIQHGGAKSKPVTIADLKDIESSIAVPADIATIAADDAAAKRNALDKISRKQGGQAHINHMQDMKMSSFLIQKAENLNKDAAQLGDYVKAVVQRTLPTRKAYEALKST